MSGDPRLQAVEQFYDFHPISAQHIFDAAAARGIAREHISEEVLQLHDQDHYGGTAAVDRLMAEAGVTAADRVLDICSGLGGPARYLAWKTGCRVTGIDLTASRVEGATALTAAAGLAVRAQFRQGNALALPFADAASRWPSARRPLRTSRTSRRGWPASRVCCSPAAGWCFPTS